MGYQFPKRFQKYAKNTGYLFFEKAARMVFMLTIWAYVARHLGPEQFGFLNYALSFVFLFQIFADLGLEPIVVQQLVKYEDKRDIILGSAFILKFVGGVLAVILIFICTALIDISSLERMVIRLISLQLIFDSARVVDYYFQSKVISKYTVFCLLVALLVSSAAYMIIIRLGLPLSYFASIIVVEALITAIGLFIAYWYKKGKIISWKANLGEIQSLFKQAWPLILTGFAVALYMRIDQIMIESMLGSRYVGYYSSAVRISEAFYFIPLILSSTLFPAIVSAKNKEVGVYHKTVQRYLALLFWISFVICVFVAMSSKFIINTIYGPLYGPAADVLSIHIWASLFTFLGVGVSKWMINENLQIFNMIYAICGVVVNIFLNLLLIPRMGIIGAAWATVLTYFFVVVIINLFHKKTRMIFSLQLNALNSAIWYNTKEKSI